MRLGMFGLMMSALALYAVCRPQTKAYAQTAPFKQDLLRGEKEEAVAEGLIRKRVEDLAKAIGAKDIDSLMSLYAPDVVSFDIGAPLLYTGAERKRQTWQGTFATFTFPIAYVIHDLNVTTDGDLAFVHSLNHMKGTLPSGHITDLWVRWTACFRRIHGVWRIVHDHVSVPADLEHGQAFLNLTP